MKTRSSSALRERRPGMKRSRTDGGLVCLVRIAFRTARESRQPTDSNRSVVRLCLRSASSQARSLSRPRQPRPKSRHFCRSSSGSRDVRTILDEGVIPQSQFLRGLFSPGSDRLREPNRDLRNRRPFLLLSAGVYGLAILDMHETVSVGGYEHDPLTRPFVKLTPPAYYAGGIALATGVNWMAAKMERSRRWRRIWWLPQACSMAGNLWGYTSTKARE